MKHAIILYFLVTTLFTYGQSTVSISNIDPRLDIHGDTIDVHDGRVIQFGDMFYWYGTHYGTTTGFVRSNHFRCYSSPDLMSWTPEGPLLEDQPSGIYYRPHVVYHEESKQYVLWYNWYPKLWTGRFGVAVSDSPVGPFKIVNDDVKVAHSDLGVGDYSIYIDDDKTAYLSYNTISGHRLSIEKLSSDYLSSTLENGGFITDHCEAGAIFKREETYYLLTDYTCCFCTQGSGARVYTSDQPLSGYIYQNNINRKQGTTAYGLMDWIKTPSEFTTIKRQDDGMFPEMIISLAENIRADKLTMYQFTGNRNGICGDTVATHTHDLIHTPTIKLSRLVDGKRSATSLEARFTGSSIYNEISFTLDSENIGSNLKITFDTLYPYDEIRLAEVEFMYEGQKIDLLRTGSSVLIEDVDALYSIPIVPAQQTYVMELHTTEGRQFIWMGDLWGSASDNIKGHDYQYWSPPLEFDSRGGIKPMKWTDVWTVELPR